MQVIHHHLHSPPPVGIPHILIRANRETLAKRRWRGVAADGMEFGFDLDHLLAHGDGVFCNSEAYYLIDQVAEPVLEIPLAPIPSSAAQLGWKIGNLHFAIEVTPTVIRVADDTAIRQMFQREGITFTSVLAVFCPLHAAPHSHGHAPSHD